ncbi:sporulation peptidase YabG [Paenibacillus swuensis]|uniref:Sporulation peptidase YabG n=1 Tax=Paenibacillus swuensis TaxID=1178515 RepID=A0A172TG37_9BACL|nr:sporulation peptidase YabG [Paenibacillus swuensis]ANE46001.1 sporulation peptidase YabG [Paenibacillus swuensis]
MKQGDLVVRISYGKDILFIIEALDTHMAIIKGFDFRLIADAPVSDLEEIADVASFKARKQDQERVQQSMRSLEWHRYEQVRKVRSYRGYTTAEPQEQQVQTADSSQQLYFEVPGKVLHLDGDPNYLQKSMALYEKLRVPVEGHYIQESNMPEALRVLLPQAKPDIVVITGHDSVIKQQRDSNLYNLSSYKNSAHFASAVMIARQYEKNRDSLTIIAGACQSHFEALLQAGANFASSPGRILIHALDPVYIAAKASFTSIKDTINIVDVINHTISGMEGVGGIETRGSYRIGLPNLMEYQNKLIPNA